MVFRLVIVTGMSGAGKSIALNILEDNGYFCVDNLPVSLIDKCAILMADGQHGNITKLAVGVDIRNGVELGNELRLKLEELKEMGFPYEILFLEASDDILIKRYKETRRNHPLSGINRIQVGIDREREILREIKKRSDVIIDTSQLLTRELKVELEKVFVQDRQFSNLMITVLSFGFKYGIPSDADLVFDVRFLPNPYYFEEMRPLSGNDAVVREYVMSFDAAVMFRNKLCDLIEFLIPHYIEEGKNQLVIAVGCTGGKHRSVTLANELYEQLARTQECGVRIEHRDLEKDAKRKQV